MTILDANSAAHLPFIRELFIEYANSLETDLCFQNFQEELSGLPGKYAPPQGRLLLALHEIAPAGCVGLRPLDASICEMKRLYVRPAHRGMGLGRTLTQAIITSARESGYAAMRLDTLAIMRQAQSLYQSLGFARIKPYYHNPNPDTVFMELKLNTSRQIKTVL